jgi:16S rRNA A1518/A1519 N6-dimethyltransferase RsmA/KsgA/DIM1 with predicted DNA glycosylase/AP lyase activity
MLVGNLSEFFPREKILEAFQKIGLNEKVRAENLTLENWRELIIALNKPATRIT